MLKAGLVVNFNLKYFRYSIFIMVVIATIYFLFLVWEILLSFFLGTIIAYLLFRPVKLIEDRGIKRVYAILILYTLLIGTVSIVLSF